MDMSLGRFRELDREAWHAAVHEFAESDMTERLNWTELKRLAHLNSVVLLCISYNNDSEDGFKDKK